MKLIELSGTKKKVSFCLQKKMHLPSKNQFKESTRTWWKKLKDWRNKTKEIRGKKLQQLVEILVWIIINFMLQAKMYLEDLILVELDKDWITGQVLVMSFSKVLTIWTWIRSEIWQESAHLDKISELTRAWTTWNLDFLTSSAHSSGSESFLKAKYWMLRLKVQWLSHSLWWAN